MERKPIAITIWPRKAVLKFDDKEIAIKRTMFGSEVDTGEFKDTLASQIASALLTPMDNVMRVLNDVDAKYLSRLSEKRLDEIEEKFW